MKELIIETLAVVAVLAAAFWAVDGFGKETTPLDEAINRPVDVRVIRTPHAECVIVTKHNHTYVQCVPIDKE